MDKKKLIVIVIVSVIVIAIGITLYYVLRPESTQGNGDYEGNGQNNADKGKNKTDNKTDNKIPLILQRVKDKLGLGAIYYTKPQKNIALLNIKGKKDTYTVSFYDNSRILFFNSKKQIILKGDYNDAGSVIMIQGSVNQRFENVSVWANINNVLNSYGL